MATDYILFVHGVNTREVRETPEYANKLFALIKQSADSSLNLKPVSLYWGDVNKDKEEELKSNLKDSQAWDKLWFKDFRTKQLLQFSGDATLYISRHIGSLVVKALKNGALQGLKGYNPFEDRLHLVTHSWGTVILFDILFADRWEDPNIPGYQDAQDIRRSLFGLPPEAEKGIRLASIHTMGSPIAFFSLLSVNQSSHDFQPRFNELLKQLYKNQGKGLPWLNFIHPGDPVAWPLENLLSNLIDGDAKYLDFQDIITQNGDLSDFITLPISQSMLALLHGGDAHGSYWESKQVAQAIARVIMQESQLLAARV